MTVMDFRAQNHEASRRRLVCLMARKKIPFEVPVVPDDWQNWALDCGDDLVKSVVGELINTSKRK